MILMEAEPDPRVRPPRLGKLGSKTYFKKRWGDPPPLPLGSSLLAKLVGASYQSRPICRYMCTIYSRCDIALGSVSKAFVYRFVDQDHGKRPYI